ncbi:MAG TPA: 50S ribosomal protein L16 [Methanomicrobiales archaeon]|nr:50S ribosomal protein L16 [Methanomicrobiales archaeon]
MVRKPGRMYRNLAKKAYTRREYMGGVPGSRLVQFDMGNLTEDFPLEAALIVEEGCQIRHTALEAARVVINRRLQDLGRANFRLKIRVYPHHILRENKQATGAGADRVSEGMRLSFGKPVGSAARVYPGQKILSVYTLLPNLEKVKDALRHGAHKLPSPSRIVIATHKVSGIRATHVKIAEEKVVAPPVAAVAEAEAAAPGAEKEAEKGIEKGVEKGAGKPGEKAPEKGAGKGEKTPEKGAGKPGEKGAEKAPEKGAGKGEKHHEKSRG